MSEQQRHFDGANWWTWNGTEWQLDGKQAEPESPEAARRRKLLPFIVIPVVLLGLLAFFAWPRSAPRLNVPSIRTVLYEVEGTARVVDITIKTATGIKQQSSVTVPMTTKGKRGMQLTFTSGSFVSIAAQNQGDSGTVICRISVDGVVISENTASGAYTIATCDGSA